MDNPETIAQTTEPAPASPGQPPGPGRGDIATLDKHVPLYLRFLLEVVTGAMTYGRDMVTFHRDRVDAFWSLIRGGKSRSEQQA